MTAHLLDVPFALVSLVDEDRQWFKARYGIDVTETPRDVSFCGHVVALDRPLVVPDARADGRFADNPLVVGDPQVRFYLGYPLRTPDGHVLGTLCAIDQRERVVGEREHELLATLAEQTMTQLELRRQGRLLTEERTRLRAILDAAVDVIITIDEQGNIDQVNRAVEPLTGHRPEELLGCSVCGLMPEPHATAHPGHLRRHLEHPAPHPIHRTREVLVKRRDGTTFPADLSVGALEIDGRRLFTGVLRDISARKEAETRLNEALSDLRQSRDHLEQVLEQLRVGTLVVSPRGTVTYLSGSCARAAGVDPAGALEARWEDVLRVDPATRETIRRLARLPAAERTRLELPLDAGATRRWLELDVRDDPRDPERRIFFLYDVSAVHELRSQLGRQHPGLMVGSSRAMQTLYREIDEVAAGDWTVLVEGETGSGKELVAQSIHRASGRREGPFVAVNCAGLTESILGSQLFGHARGAFTGATADQVGFFEAASGGTLFLDEIGDVPPAIQSALLRALQEREVTRLGETRPRKVDVRIVTATNRDLRRRVAEGHFREDLLYRLLVGRIRVPPLRERREDIPALVAAFLAEERVTGGKLVTDASPAVLEALSRHAWPGNVRELRSAIEHAVIRCRSRRIELVDLPTEIGTGGASAAPGPAPAPRQDVEPGDRDRIAAALERTGGNRVRAARLLGVSRATLYRRIEALGLAGVGRADDDAAP
jgi:PAS domain S-box-containing protein